MLFLSLLCRTARTPTVRLRARQQHCTNQARQCGAGPDFLSRRRGGGEGERSSDRECRFDFDLCSFFSFFLQASARSKFQHGERVALAGVPASAHVLLRAAASMLQGLPCTPTCLCRASGSACGPCRGRACDHRDRRHGPPLVRLTGVSQHPTNLCTHTLRLGQLCRQATLSKPFCPPVPAQRLQSSMFQFVARTETVTDEKVVVILG